MEKSSFLFLIYHQTSYFESEQGRRVYNVGIALLLYYLFIKCMIILFNL